MVFPFVIHHSDILHVVRVITKSMFSNKNQSDFYDNFILEKKVLVWCMRKYKTFMISMYLLSSFNFNSRICQFAHKSVNDLQNEIHTINVEKKINDECLSHSF